MMVEVYRTIEERRKELRETSAELALLVAEEEAAHEALKDAELAWRAAKDAASKVRDRRNTQIHGLAAAVASGQVDRRDLATDAGVVPKYLQRLLGDEPTRSDS
jgi:CHASE3 domain sensor protein